MATNLIQIVDPALASAVARSGDHLACRPGCFQCCVGVFPISHQDAARLRDGLASLSETDSVRARNLRERVAASLTRIQPLFPGDPVTGIVSADDAAQEAFEDYANDEPCPVLDIATGTCDLYNSRPVLCRTFGPPARTEDGDLAHCELCFTQATTAQVTAAELDPTLPKTIAESDEAYDLARQLHGETLIAYALRSEL